MDGGAWNSEVFDNGRDFQKARAPGGQAASGVESGSAPAMYNPSPALVGKDSRMFGVLIVTLRSALVVLTLIGLSVMAANKQTLYGIYEGIYFTSTIKFAAVHAFVGLLSFDAIVCFYSIVQLVLCVVQVLSTGTFVSSAAAGGSLLTFIFDSLLAHALIAAAAAAATAQAHLQEADYCQLYPGFCRKAQASIVLSFFAFAILALCAALYPIRLLRMSK